MFGHQLQLAQDIQKVEFSTLSRGGHFEKIVITKDKLSFQQEERRLKKETQALSRMLKEVEWEQLLQKIENLNLQEISKLKSPTMKRAFDGARHSQIIVSTFDNQQYIHRFDNEDPNALLKPLLQSILKLQNLN